MSAGSLTGTHRFEFDIVFFDLDGTVCLSGEPIGQVVDKLGQFLSRNGRQGVLVTNNSSKSSANYRAKLRDLGLDADKISVVTPVEVGADHLFRSGFNRPHILGTETCKGGFRELGLDHEENDPDCVVTTFDTDLTYAKLERCAYFIQHGLPLFQANIDPFCPTDRGGVPDCGAIQAALTRSTGVRPRAHFGKPGRLMTRFLRQRFRLGQLRAAMVGDRQSTDVLLGNRMGATSIWVRSGDPQISRIARPDFVYPTMEAFLDDCA